ncbi:MAG: ABC transporter permease [Lachnospiraceae bacterium]|nr:ABC transporter permease [Lachnospiraceae bacterium]
MSKKPSLLEKCYVGLIFFLLYAPILILIVCSFNASKSRVVWGGFTFDWYIALFQNEEVLSAIRTSLMLTFSAALIATLLGTFACIGMSVFKKNSRQTMMTITNIPMLNADIVTGIAIMLLFVRFWNLGFMSMLVAHVTLGVPYVILNVMPKLNQTSRITYEAAMDLGASPVYAFWKVVLPDIMPGIFSGFLLAFTISLDDFVITYFTKGAGMNTISTMIYQQARRGINPEMYALSTILFLLILVVLWIVNRSTASRPQEQSN